MENPRPIDPRPQAIPFTSADELMFRMDMMRRLHNDPKTVTEIYEDEWYDTRCLPGLRLHSVHVWKNPTDNEKAVMVFMPAALSFAKKDTLVLERLHRACNRLRMSLSIVIELHGYDSEATVLHQAIDSLDADNQRRLFGYRFGIAPELDEEHAQEQLKVLEQRITAYKLQIKRMLADRQP